LAAPAIASSGVAGRGGKVFKKIIAYLLIFIVGVFNPVNIVKISYAESIINNFSYNESAAKQGTLKVSWSIKSDYKTPNDYDRAVAITVTDLYTNKVNDKKVLSEFNASASGFTLGTEYFPRSTSFDTSHNYTITLSAGYSSMDSESGVIIFTTMEDKSIDVTNQVPKNEYKPNNFNLMFEVKTEEAYVNIYFDPCENTSDPQFCGYYKIYKNESYTSPIKSFDTKATSYSHLDKVEFNKTYTYSACAGMNGASSFDSGACVKSSITVPDKQSAIEGSELIKKIEAKIKELSGTTDPAKINILKADIEKLMKEADNDPNLKNLEYLARLKKQFTDTLTHARSGKSDGECGCGELKFIEKTACQMLCTISKGFAWLVAWAMNLMLSSVLEKTPGDSSWNLTITPQK